VGFKLTTLVAIGTDCIGRFKSNYQINMTTTVPEVKGSSKIVVSFFCDALTSNHHLYGVMLGSHFQNDQSAMSLLNL
jgi:hypothetical protein